MGDGLLSRHASTSSTVADLYMFVNCETGTPISFKADIFTKMTCNRGLPCSCIMKDNVMRNVKDGSIQLPRSVKRRQRCERSILPHPVPSLHIERCAAVCQTYASLENSNVNASVQGRSMLFPT